MAVGDFVTLQGLEIPTVESILEELSTEQRATIDPGLNTDPDSVIGQLNGIFASHLREAYEALQIAYHGFDPDNSEGFLLVSLSALTGTTPAQATKSKFVDSRRLRVNLAANKTVPIGTIFAVAGNETIRFVTKTSVSSTLAGDYFVDAEAETAGAIVCNAGTLTVIATPVVGLNSVINDFDAIVGQEADNDQQLRERREDELRATGSGTVDSLRADVLAIELEDQSKPILNCTAFENDQNVTDPITGNPAHSIEILVYDGLVPACPNDTLAQTIWNGKPGGIQLVGSSSGNATDSEGEAHVVPFTRVTITQIKFNFSLTVETAKYAGDIAVKAAVKTEFESKVNPGKTIRANDYVKALMGVSGVLDVTNMQIARVGFPFPPSGTNLSLGLREMGDAQTAFMSVFTTPGVP